MEGSHRRMLQKDDTPFSSGHRSCRSGHRGGVEGALWSSSGEGCPVGVAGHDSEGGRRDLGDLVAVSFHVLHLS